MDILIALAMPLWALSPIGAQDAKVCPDAAGVITLKRLADLPEEVHRDVLSDGRLADAGQPYHTFETSLNDTLPVRRFVRAGRAGNAMYVWVESGMPALLQDEIFGFGYAEGHWHRTSASEGNPCVAAQAVVAGVASTLRSNPRPLVYKDQRANVIFVVGRDGRHVTAIDAGGKVVWDVDPFVDGKLDPYRRIHPIISRIGPAPTYLKGVDPSDYISVVYDTSQSGMLRISDGAFTFLGQD